MTEYTGKVQARQEARIARILYVTRWVGDRSLVLCEEQTREIRLHRDRQPTDSIKLSR